VGLKVDGKYDGERIGDDGWNVVAINVGRNITSTLALPETHSEPREAE